MWTISSWTVKSMCWMPMRRSAPMIKLFSWRTMWGVPLINWPSTARPSPVSMSPPTSAACGLLPPPLMPSVCCQQLVMALPTTPPILVQSLVASMPIGMPTKSTPMMPYLAPTTPPSRRMAMAVAAGPKLPISTPAFKFRRPFRALHRIREFRMPW